MKHEQYYRELIMRHNDAPFSFGELDEYSSKIVAHNPACGDHYEIYLKLKDGKINEISFTGAGCAISKASTSMFIERIQGLSINEVKQLYQSFSNLFRDNEQFTLDELDAFKGVKYMPARINCALLSWNATVESLMDIHYE